MLRSYSLGLSVILALIGVVSSSSLSNLMGFTSSSSQDGLNSQQHYSSCVADEDLVFLQARRSIVFCLRECTDDNRYMMYTENNATIGADNTNPQERQEGKHPSWSKTALLSLLWYLCFTSFGMQQLILLLSFLLIVECSFGIDIILSFFLAAVPYLLLATYGPNKDYEETDGDDEDEDLWSLAGRY